MTEQQMRAFELRMNGMTYEQIGSALGCTKQNVMILLENGLKSINVTKRRGRARKDGVYPNINQRMLEMDMTYTELSQLTGISANALRQMLTVKRDILLGNARKIAHALELSVEEAFAEEDETI